MELIKYYNKILDYIFNDDIIIEKLEINGIKKVCKIKNYEDKNKYIVKNWNTFVIYLTYKNKIEDEIWKI